MIFKSRFNRPTTSTPRRTAPEIHATYTDRADISGREIELDDLRRFVDAMRDWPGDARVDVRRSALPDYRRLPGVSEPDVIGIVVNIRETE